MENQGNLVLGINEQPKPLQWFLLSFQHVFAMFGATVLVPILTGLPVSVSLFASGIGTLIYIGITKAKVPVYLGSSFAYIAAIQVASSDGDFSSVVTGLAIVGVVYILVALLIMWVGKEWLHKILPPVVIGPMIIIIGLYLAPVAIGQSGLNPLSANAFFADLATNWRNPVVALITFGSTVAIALLAKGFFKIVPFLGGIIIGYVSAILFGLVNFAGVGEAQFLQGPAFSGIFESGFQLDFSAWAIFLPLAFVTIAEHIGDHTVLGQITDKDFISDPGLDKTLLGDGIATMVSGLIGGPANTTYGENTGVVAMTKVASVWVTGGAAVIAVLLSFLGKLNAVISSIPAPVMGGISIVLFGLIAGNGLKVLSRAKVDMNQSRNMLIISSMLVVGLGGATIMFESTTINGYLEMVSGLTGMSMAVIVGIVMNLVLPKAE